MALGRSSECQGVKRCVGIRGLLARADDRGGAPLEARCRQDGRQGHGALQSAERRPDGRCSQYPDATGRHGAARGNACVRADPVLYECTSISSAAQGGYAPVGAAAERAALLMIRHIEASTASQATVRLPEQLEIGGTQMMKEFWLLSLSTIAAAYLLPLSVYAQTATPGAEASTEIEEVVVTAERRTSDIQKVALSVTAISGAFIEQQGDSDVAQVLQNVPGVQLQGVTGGPSQQSVQGGGGPPNIAIRGLGTPSPNTVGAVAVYEDGVLLQGGGANFYDMSRVEVLRGPQGTLYGRGATAGAVNYITNIPTNEFEASGRLQYGNYDEIATQGMLNAPLSDVFSVRVAFNQIRHNGYFNNGQSNEDDISTRAKLLFRPNENFSFLLGFVYYDSSGTGPGQILLVPNPYPTQWYTNVLGGGSNPISYRKTYGDLEWALGFAKLTYIGGYQSTDSTFATYCTCFAPGPPPTPNLTYQYVTQPYNNPWTHELRLASTSDS